MDITGRHQLSMWLLRALSVLLVAGMAADALGAGFPKAQPEGASFPRPLDGEVLDVSPPGFCWWRAGERGAVFYRLRITDAAGEEVYSSAILDAPVHVPDRVLPAGSYTWQVDALDAAGKTLDVWPARRFTISEGASGQPWIAPEVLIARVPAEHPRLLFPKAKLDEIRTTLATTRKEVFESIVEEANRALRLDVPPEPDYDKIDDPAKRRLAYFQSFGEMRGYHNSGMHPLALAYLLTGDKRYGEKAKAILLGAAEWDPEGISSIMAPYGDEVGLGLVKSAPETYDWIHDLLTPEERDKVRKMLIARADQMLRRLEKRDYQASPAESHAGRLPGYLIEHAIVLAEEPRAQVWLGYGLETAMTCFPHWAGKDGGWAEGISYALAYNSIYLSPFESLRHATGFDLWQRPFYRKVRNFFLYCISPLGDISPFGDSEHSPSYERGGTVRSLLLFHANRYEDPTLRWWIDLFKDGGGNVAAASGIPALVLPDTVAPRRPETIPNDAAFMGVGWAALHSNILEPREDLFVLFKSSPYGGVSHSHADQNSFAIMKGGHSLAIPAGARYPHHGSPFHTEYVQQTVAHNAVLVNGEGQVGRASSRGGMLADFQSTAHLGYVCGDATNCFGDRLERNRRHVVLVRPSLIIVVDDLAATQPAEFQWLLHNHEQFKLDEEAQTLTSTKRRESMTVRLIADGGFRFGQTDAWPLDPRTGFPTADITPPEKQWHFSATTREKAAQRRIAAIMTFNEDKVELHRDGHRLGIASSTSEGRSEVEINLEAGATPLLEAHFTPTSGQPEHMTAKF